MIHRFIDIHLGVECDRSTIWVYDEIRKVLWSRVPSNKNRGKLITLEVNVSGHETKRSFVGETFFTQKTINVEDAYADPR